MVYETDFYTIRRPYTRPTITSYTVTGCRPCVWRTTTVSPVGAHSKVRLSLLLGELNRIQNRPRMHLGYVPTEDFLNSRPLVEFDDETKYIRAEADKLMKYLYVSVPHQTSKLPPKITTSYDRLISNGLVPYGRYGRNIPNDILNMSYYYEPTRTTIGRGHLACVTFAGGRGYPRRKHLFSDEYRDIGDEIKMRSYYNKNVHPSNRLDDALALPTGFAYRLLTTERKPYNITPEEERKSNAALRFKRSELASTKTPAESVASIQKKERFLDSDISDSKKEMNDTIEEKSKKYEDMIVPKMNKTRIDSIEETKQNKDEKISKKSEETVLSSEPIEKIAKVEQEATPQTTEEKVKPKKEQRRKLSEKLSEESSSTDKTPAAPKETKIEESKPEKSTRKVSETKPVVTEKPVASQKQAASEKPVASQKQAASEKPVDKEKPAVPSEKTATPEVPADSEKEAASEKSTSLEKPTVQEEEKLDEPQVVVETPTVEKTSKRDSIKTEPKIATESPAESKEIKEEKIESVKAEIPLETEPIPEVKSETVPVEIPDESVSTINEEVKKEVEEQEKKEVESKDIKTIEAEIKEAVIKAAESKTTEVVKEEEQIQEIKVEEPVEQIVETKVSETEAEPKVEGDKAIVDILPTTEANESSTSIKNENESSSVTIIQDIVTSPIIESPKEEANIELTKKTITITNQIIIEGGTEVEITKESSSSTITMSSSDIKDTSEPIIEEPMSPEITKTVPFSEEIITDQSVL